MSQLYRSIRFLFLASCLAWSSALFADTLSLSGNLGNGAGATAIHFTIDAGQDLVIQTYGYGGGTNAAGTTFSGTGDQAGFMSTLGLYDAAGNLLMDSGASPDYGCNDMGPGTANVDGSFTCGDSYLSLRDYTFDVSDTAPAGSYTLVLFAGYVPDGTLPADLSAYTFPTDGSVYRYDGQTVTDFYAVDISGASISPPSSVSSVPEPSALWLMAAGASVWSLRRRGWQCR